MIGHPVSMTIPPPPPPPPPLPLQPVRFPEFRWNQAVYDYFYFWFGFQVPTPVESLAPVEATPIVEEPKLVEENVPIKKYYGRKRDDQSSSEDSDYSYDANNVAPMDTTKYLFCFQNQRIQF